MKKDKLVNYGGEGYGYSKEVGEYEVKTNESSKKFKSLSKAKRYFDSLDEEKFIWNLNTLELLDGYVYEN